MQKINHCNKLDKWAGTGISVMKIIVSVYTSPKLRHHEQKKKDFIVMQS